MTIHRDSRRRSYQSEAGFTQLELLVVLAIVAMAFAIAGSYTSRPAHTAELPVITQNLASQLRIARARTLSTSRSLGITFRPGSLSYQTEVDGKVYQLPADVRLTVSGEARQDAADITQIIFYGDGSSTGGSVRLERGGRVTSVAVEWLTGHISIADAR